jgi:hypothetical protein
VLVQRPELLQVMRKVAANIVVLKLAHNSLTGNARAARTLAHRVTLNPPSLHFYAS